jgi:hypothetical protein
MSKDALEVHPGTPVIQMMAKYFDAFLYLANWGYPAPDVPRP